MTEANAGRLPTSLSAISRSSETPQKSLEQQLAEANIKADNAERQHLEDKKIIEDLRLRLKQTEIKLEQSEKDRLTDPLTGCYSCHAWLDLQLHFDQKRGDRATLIMIDLNNLKKINDQKGHEAGDEYLKRTVSSLDTIFSRRGDKIHRVGGDEFVIFCKFVPLDKREEFNSFISSSIGHEVVESLGLDFAFGVAHTDPQQDNCLADTYKRADNAMYQNKQDIKATNPSKYAK